MFSLEESSLGVGLIASVLAILTFVAAVPSWRKRQKGKNMQKKIIKAIVNNKAFTPELIVEKTGFSSDEVEQVLFSLRDEGFIVINGGGSISISTFEIVKSLDGFIK